ncbi:universal stress protein [Nocardia vulneris]|uniref:Universal stress protein n=1 Tax=Nocardia vulneris TaxID=1141657 RepID=A0ABR4ZBJ6_9NOCA|nr:universal stress protein [Nocardia vulneris]KIA62504.1 universal stress protein [Nocardia vulneris]
MATQLTDDPHRIATAPVVVGVDGSAAADHAVCWAATTAAARSRRLRLVNGLDIAAKRGVLGSYDLMIPAVLDSIRRQGGERVAAARALALRLEPSLVVETEVSQSNPAELLIDRSAAAHLVAIGASGEGATIRHLGSTLLAVASHGHGSIVVVRGTEWSPDSTAPVVVGVDGSAAGEVALGAAFAEARDRNARLVAVHVWSDLHFDRFAGFSGTITDPTVAAEAHALLATQLSGWHDKYPEVVVTSEVYLSGPRHYLLEWSKAAQLVVVGSRGRGGFRGLLLGSTSNALVQRAHCPVQVVHAS